MRRVSEGLLKEAWKNKELKGTARIADLRKTSSTNMIINQKMRDQRPRKNVKSQNQINKSHILYIYVSPFPGKKVTKNSHISELHRKQNPAKTVLS